MHTLSTVLALSLDPKQILSDFGGAATIALILIIFAETGLVAVPFLPGDSLLFAVGAVSASSGSPIRVEVLAVLLVVAAILAVAASRDLIASFGSAAAIAL